ncbi:MAG TPA: hypothetical protein VFM24_06005, partial [Nitrospira sp.]|nr:hypothetical protein [Nitrospira sp.]
MKTSHSWLRQVGRAGSFGHRHLKRHKIERRDRGKQQRLQHVFRRRSMNVFGRRQRRLQQP